MIRVLRCHDFGTGREATRREYREYSARSRGTNRKRKDDLAF